MAVIPTRKSRKLSVAIDRKLHKLRNLVERCYEKLTNARRIATRYDKTADSLLASSTSRPSASGSAICQYDLSGARHLITTRL